MNRALFLVAALASAVVVNLAATLATSRFIVDRTANRFERAAAASGQAISQRPTDRSRAVVKPNPDLLFGVCAHPHGRTATRVTLAPPAGYWSISVFDADGTPHFIANRRNSPPGPVRLEIGSGAAPADGARPVPAGPGRNVVILRILPVDPGNDAPEQAALRSFRCRASKA